MKRIGNITVQVEGSNRPNLPNMLASATVTIETEAGPVRIHDCRLLQNKNGIVWFSFPTFSVQHGQRQFEYKPTVEMPPALAQQISTEALRAYEQWKQGGVR
ncbi:MAG TPA: hypothetical protein VE994_21620 [Terriglobales bacterium]|nr:hypothetical protein [Terriglobales bacterium]